MMKYIFLLATIIPMSHFAQTNVGGKVGYSEVVDVKSATAGTLSSRANSFLQSKKIEPKTAGTIITGTGSFTVTYMSVKKAMDKGYVKFKVKIMVKDGKYKAELTDFAHEGIQGKSTGGSLDLDKPECGEAQLTATAWVSIKQQTQEQLKAFVEEMKIKMDNPVKAAAPSSDF